MAEIRTLFSEAHFGHIADQLFPVLKAAGPHLKVLQLTAAEDQIAVDTHVERVSKRLYLASTNDSVYNIEMKLRKAFKKETWNKRHKQLVLFGRYYCKAIKPECNTCKLKDICRYYKKEGKM